MNTNKIREALEHGRNMAIDKQIITGKPHSIIIGVFNDALAELDKPAEPVAWMVITRIGVEWVRTLGVTKTGARQIAIERYRNGSDVQHMDPIPLYTHPPQAGNADPVAWMHPSKLGHVPEGAVIVWRRKRKPHHNWEYGVYVENDSKARDQFGLGGCEVMVLEWPGARLTAAIEAKR